jgi:hypothetical protein
MPLTAIGFTLGGSSTLHIYTKQYTEQHKATDYTEQNIHKNKIHERTNKIHKRNKKYIIYQIKHKHTKHTTLYALIKNGTKII